MYDGTRTVPDTEQAPSYWSPFRGSFLVWVGNGAWVLSFSSWKAWDRRCWVFWRVPRGIPELASAFSSDRGHRLFPPETQIPSL